jgi:hypothetical protein
MTNHAKSEDALVVQQPVSVMPVVSGAEFAEQFKAYKALQKSIDESMPEEIMRIQGKPYRKKRYWQALRAAFNLTVECVHDERVELTLDDGSVDWGWNVRYRATASSGAAFMDGDGSCFASEKTGGRLRATEHNVRAHAHTRAQNRAISGLVGFGEVSADEMPEQGRVPTPAGRSRISDDTYAEFVADLASKSEAHGSAGLRKILLEARLTPDGRGCQQRLHGDEETQGRLRAVARKADAQIFAALKKRILAAAERGGQAEAEAIFDEAQPQLIEKMEADTGFMETLSGVTDRWESKRLEPSHVE